MIRRNITNTVKMKPITQESVLQSVMPRLLSINGLLLSHTCSMSLSDLELQYDEASAVLLITQLKCSNTALSTWIVHVQLVTIPDIVHSHYQDPTCPYTYNSNSLIDNTIIPRTSTEQEQYAACKWGKQWSWTRTSRASQTEDTGEWCQTDQL
jgi:hypothetical protein